MYTLIVFAFLAGSPTIWLITGQYSQAVCEQKLAQYQAQAVAQLPGAQIVANCYRMAA